MATMPAADAATASDGAPLLVQEQQQVQDNWWRTSAGMTKVSRKITSLMRYKGVEGDWYHKEALLQHLQAELIKKFTMEDLEYMLAHYTNRFMNKHFNGVPYYKTAPSKHHAREDAQ